MSNKRKTGVDSVSGDNHRGETFIRILLVIVLLLMIIVLIPIIGIVWPAILKPQAPMPMPQTVAPPTSAPISTTLVTPMLANYSTLDSTIITLGKTKNLVVGISNESGPYSYAESVGSSTYLGFEVELVKEMVRRWSQSSGEIKLEFVGLDITRRFSAVKEGKVDFTIAAVPNTAKNCQDPAMICTKKAYMNDELKILVRSATTEINDTMSLDAFCNYFKPPTLIGFITGTVAQQELPRIFSQCSFKLLPEQYKEYTDREQAIQGVLKKEVAGYITHGRILEFYRQQSPAPDQLKVVGLRSIATASSTESTPFLASFVVVEQEDRTGLRDLIDLTLVAMQDDQTYSKLYNNTSYGKFFSDPIIPIPVTVFDCSALKLHWEAVKAPEVVTKEPKCATK